jgi:biotin operon repressor
MSNLVQTFKALADPTRLRMIGLMVDERRCGRELASELGVSAPTVSHHLQILRDAGLLSEMRENPYTFYKLDLSALQKQVMRVSDKREVQKLAAGEGLAEEKRQVLKNFFDGDRLKRIPAQRRKKEIVFEEILRRLPERDVYTERALSRMIEAIHSDFCTIRREFIMGKYMERDKGKYRLTARGRAALEHKLDA